MDAANRTAEFVQALVVELIRADIVPTKAIEALARRFDDEAEFYAGSDRADHYEQMADAARMMVVEAQGQTPTEFRAGQRRKRLHVVAPDGGKAND